MCIAPSRVLYSWINRFFCYVFLLCYIVWYGNTFMVDTVKVDTAKDKYPSTLFIFDATP
jgi:hypothetical protein